MKIILNSAVLAYSLLILSKVQQSSNTDQMLCSFEPDVVEQCSSHCYGIVKPLIKHVLQLKVKNKDELTVCQEQRKDLQSEVNSLKNQILIEKLKSDLKEQKGLQSKLENKIERLENTHQLVEAENSQSVKQLNSLSEALNKTTEILLEVKQSVELLKSKPNSCVRLGFSSGIQEINIPGISPFSVRCEGNLMAGPGWMVIQNRFDGSIDFYRNWTEYRMGFGDLNGEFFMGLDKLYWLTNYQQQELYIQLEYFDGTRKFAQYDNFRIGKESEDFMIKSIGDFNGTAKNGMVYHNIQMFSTYDRDNDEWIENCAINYHGGWWYNDCVGVNLNGKYYAYGGENEDGIFWSGFTNPKSVQMLIRPKYWKT